MKTKKVNIYLTNLERKKLEEIKNKYKLSYSTIANIITEKIYMLFGEKLNNKELYTREKCYKTSIKPRQNNYLNCTNTYTNAIKIFVRNDYEKLTNNKDAIQKIQNFIYAEFQNTYDPNWNGNEWQRRMPRLIRQNKEYYKRLLESEE